MILRVGHRVEFSHVPGHSPEHLHVLIKKFLGKNRSLGERSKSREFF